MSDEQNNEKFRDSALKFVASVANTLDDYIDAKMRHATTEELHELRSRFAEELYGAIIYGSADLSVAIQKGLAQDGSSDDL